MNFLASSGRCRALRGLSDTAIWKKSPSHSWAAKKFSIVCIRQTSSKSNPGIMSRLKNIFHRSSDVRAPIMSPWTRSAMNFAPKKTQPSIREPNMPEKRDKKDEKKEQSNKKPVIKTESNSNDGELAHSDNWPVEIPKDHPQPRGDEHSSKYVINHIWSINAMKNTKLENTTVENPTSANLPEDSKPTEVQSQKLVANVSSNKDVYIRVGNSSDSTNDEMFNENPDHPVSSKSHQNSEILSNNDYNIPKETPLDGEISAWKEVVERSKLNEEMALRATNLLAKANQIISIRPEPPQPKLDVQVIGSVAKDESSGNDGHYLDPRQDSTKVNLTLTKKFHTCTNCLFAGGFQANFCNNWYSILSAREDSKYDQIIFSSSKNLTPSSTVKENDSALVNKFYSWNKFSSGGNEDEKDDQVVFPYCKNLNLSSNMKRNHVALLNKFYSCSKCFSDAKFKDHRCINWYSTSTRSDGDDKDFQACSPDSENLSRTETDESKQIQSPQDDHDVPKVAMDFKNTLQDLSRREMDVFLSYKQQMTEESGSNPRLPTSVTISTFPSGTCQNSSDLVELNDTNNFDVENDNHPEMTELEKTILKLNEREDSEEGKNRKDKKGQKDGDYIKIPGDPYPYSREHYEKWRVPHGRCPIVNDDVPKVKPAETSDSQCR